MKILFISTSSGSRGGGELYLVRLARGLFKQGHTVSLACSESPQMSELASAFSKYGDVIKFPYINTYQSSLRSIRHAFPIAKQFPQLKKFCDSEKPDLLHLNKQNLEDGLDLLAWVSESKIPAVQTVHILRTPTELNTKLGWVRDRVSRHFLRKYALPTILVASRSERENLLKKGIIARKSTRHIANGVEDIGPREKQHFTPLRFLSVARLHEQKRPLLWLEWVELLNQRLESAVFDWVGNGALEPQFLGCIKSKGISNLEYHGWQHEPASFFKRAHYLLHSAAYEGQPFAILEAFSAGIPVIADEELIHSQPELAPAMISIDRVFKSPETLNSPTFYASASHKARELYEVHFSIEEMARNTEDFYQTLINR